MSTRLCLVALATAYGLVSPSWAQCEWRSANTKGPELASWVQAIEVHDNGSGPKLFVGGIFDGGGAAGGPASWVAKLNNAGKWGAIGNELGDRVETLASFDFGGGPELFAGGRFNEGFKAWDGSWGSLGSGIQPAFVAASVVFDDGSGPALYVGGFFSTAGGTPVQNVARWNGSVWTGVGAGINSGIFGGVKALAVFDDGQGAKLFAGGDFNPSNGGSPDSVLCWDGAVWSPAWPGGGEIEALEVFDDGSGPALYVGGDFESLGAVSALNIARWDGTTLSPVGAGIHAQSSFGGVFALEAWDDGTGPQLYAGGIFEFADNRPMDNISRWNGSEWSRLGVWGPTSVLAMKGFDDGSGPALYVGGQFTSVGPLPMYFAAKYSPAATTNGTNYCTAGTTAGGCQSSIHACGSPSATASSGFELQVTDYDALKQGLFFFGTGGRQANSWGSGTSFQCVVPPVARGALLAGNGSFGTCEGSQIYDVNKHWTQKPSHNPGNGATVQAQFWHRDPNNTSNQKTSLSNAVEFVVGP